MKPGWLVASVLVLNFAWTKGVFASTEVRPETMICDLSSSILAGNLLGPQGLGADLIEFKKDIVVPEFDARFAEEPLSLSVGECRISPYHESGSTRIYNKGDFYGISEIRSRRGVLKISAVNVFNRPEGLFLYCPGLNGYSTVSDLERATGNAIRIRSVSDVILGR